MPPTAPEALPHRQACRACGRAWRVAWIGAGACALLAVSLLATMAWALTQRRGNQGAGFAVAELLGLILLAAIPTAIACLTGAGLSVYAWRQCGSGESKQALGLSVGAPLALIALLVAIELAAAMLSALF